MGIKMLLTGINFLVSLILCGIILYPYFSHQPISHDLFTKYIMLILLVQQFYIFLCFFGKKSFMQYFIWFIGACITNTLTVAFLYDRGIFMQKPTTGNEGPPPPPAQEA